MASFSSAEFKAQITEMIKTCMETACEQVSKTIKEIKLTATTPDVPDIAALRAQIIDNVYYILPELYPNSLATNGDYHYEQKVYVVVEGEKPKIKAFVIFGYDANSKKTKVAESEESDSIQSALHKLLLVTMRITHGLKGDTMRGERVPIMDGELSVGSFFKDSLRKSSPNTREQQQAVWNSYIYSSATSTRDNTPATSFTTAGHSLATNGAAVSPASSGASFSTTAGVAAGPTVVNTPYKASTVPNNSTHNFVTCACKECQGLRYRATGRVNLTGLGVHY